MDLLQSKPMITVTSPDHLKIADRSLYHPMVRIRSADHPMIALVIFQSHNYPIIRLETKNLCLGGKCSFLPTSGRPSGSGDEKDKAPECLEVNS